MMKTLATAAALAALVFVPVSAHAATYQKLLTSMSCDGTVNACFGSITVPAGKTLTLQTVSCIINFNAAPASGGMGGVGAQGGFFQYFTFPGSSGKNAVIPVTSVPGTFKGGTTVTVLYAPEAGIANVSGQTCSLRGTLN